MDEKSNIIKKDLINQIESKRSKKLEFDELDLRIFNLSLSDPTMSDEEIALRFCISRSAVVRRKQKNAYKEMMQKEFEIVINDWRRISKKAFTKLELLLASDEPKIQLIACGLILKAIKDFNRNILFINQKLDSDIENVVIYKTKWRKNK